MVCFPFADFFIQCHHQVRILIWSVPWFMIKNTQINQYFSHHPRLYLVLSVNEQAMARWCPELMKTSTKPLGAVSLVLIFLIFSIIFLSDSVWIQRQGGRRLQGRQPPLCRGRGWGCGDPTQPAQTESREVQVVPWWEEMWSCVGEDASGVEQCPGMDAGFS